VATPAAFEPQACWWPVTGLPATVAVTCGTIHVPADHRAPRSQPISLAVARIHDSRSRPDEPPIVNLHGGPGGDSLSTAPTADSLPLAAIAARDLILYDQRGGGRSTPSLNCPEKEEAVLDALGTAGTWKDEFGPNEAAVKACRKRLVGKGIDLDDYDTLASVADLETIRAAFGVATWNVSGRSYGTRLGLAYARAHPEQVRSLLLDSVYSPDVSSPARNKALPRKAVAALTDACRAQPACVAANGLVKGQLADAERSFDDKPESLDGEVEVGTKAVTRHFTLTGTDLAGGIFAAQYRSSLVPQLPSVITGLARGDRSIVPAFLSTGVPGLLGMSEGAFYSFECADSGRTYGAKGFQEMRRDPGPDALYALGTAEPFCAAWDVEPLPASFAEPVVVDVPTLVFGGTLDPITPFRESRAQADRMPDARLVAVPGGGHGVAAFDDCTKSARDGFWHDPSGRGARLCRPAPGPGVRNGLTGRRRLPGQPGCVASCPRGSPTQLPPPEPPPAGPGGFSAGRRALGLSQPRRHRPLARRHRRRPRHLPPAGPGARRRPRCLRQGGAEGR